MRPEERQSYILETAKEFGFVSISKLAKALQVSRETVRRDINLLAAKAQLRKIRGGAEPLKVPFRKDKKYMWRIRSNHQEKIAIGAEAAKLIRDGTVVALAPGASVEALAACITGVRDVTLVTNSLKITEILLQKVKQKEIHGQVHFIGGIMDADNYFSKGTIATDEIDRYHFDLSFIACTAISEQGVSLYDVEECMFSRHLLNRSACSVLIAEREKIGKSSTYILAELSSFDRIITDNSAPIPESLLKALAEANTELNIAEHL